jgi:hypothetical protein
VNVPIKSYLVHSASGWRDELIRTLTALRGCTIVPATNRDVVILVTDTTDEAAEQRLQDTLARVRGLQWLTLVAGLADPHPRESQRDAS